jgi:hypothetical protein
MNDYYYFEDDKIVFKNNFNQIIDENIKKDLCSFTDIKFGHDFNQPINNLDQNIINLEFTSYSDFNQPIDNLPDSIETITFGKNFNHPVDNLPEKLKFVRFGFTFDKSLNNLPLGLITLIIYSKQYSYNFDSLPDTIEKLHIYNKCDFNKYICRWPANLKYLHLNSNFNQPIDNISNNLIELYLHDSFDQSIDSLIDCNSLKKIIFCKMSNFNKPVNLLPSCLEDDKFG